MGKLSRNAFTKIDSCSFVCFQITELKIDNNPFAKGFRESGAGKREKKRQHAPHRLMMMMNADGAAHRRQNCRPFSGGRSGCSSATQIARILGGRHDHSAGEYSDNEEEDEEEEEDGHADCDDGPTRAKRAKSSGSTSSSSATGFAGDLDARMGGGQEPAQLKPSSSSLVGAQQHAMFKVSSAK